MCEFFSFVQHRNHGFYHQPLGKHRTDSHTELLEAVGWSDDANVRGELLVARWECLPDGTPNVENWLLILDNGRSGDWMDERKAKAYAVDALHEWFDLGCDTVSDDGTQRWFKSGLRHRDDGPAVIYHNGYNQWYKDGELHRDDGPAVTCADGTEGWYRNGLRFYP